VSVGVEVAVIKREVLAPEIVKQKGRPRGCIRIGIRILNYCQAIVVDEVAEDGVREDEDGHRADQHHTCECRHAQPWQRALGGCGCRAALGPVCFGHGESASLRPTPPA
jgi:hypothetical protein